MKGEYLTKKVICIILSLCLLLSCSGIAYASDLDTPINIETMSEEPAEGRAVNWWRYGWKVMYNALNQLIEAMVSLDGESSYTSTQAYLVSPSIDFNTGTMAHTFRFKPVVNDDVYFIRMHGHRIIFVDVFSKLAITLRDSDGEVLIDDLTTTNEYTFYDRLSSDPSGTWEASYTSTDSFEWQLYYAHYYDTGSKGNTASARSLENDTGFYYDSKNRVFQFAEIDDSVEQAQDITTAKNQSLNMLQLNEQFVDKNGNAVDYLRDYDAGDSIHFADIIQAIEYCSATNITKFDFGFGDEIVSWKFKGNYSDQYSVGDTLRLVFDVVDVDTFGEYTFESLDYFEEVYSMQSEAELPTLLNYMQ